jgi:hypothetical protein
MIARIEGASVNTSIDVAARTCDALGIQADWAFRTPFVVGRQRDAAHAQCSGYVEHRLVAAGWLVAREVEIVHGRSHGWIDLLAFHEGSGMLLIVEIKTDIADLGQIERTIAWYERAAWSSARRLGWRPTSSAALLLVLATEVNEERLRLNRESLATAFPGRAPQAETVLAGRGGVSRALALIDPRSRRRVWLMRARIDGRRSPAPYVDYAGFMRRKESRQTSRSVARARSRLAQVDEVARSSAAVAGRASTRQSPSRS